MSSLFALAVLAAPALAHMEMSWPYPLHSKFNPATPQNIIGELNGNRQAEPSSHSADYSMTNPLGTGQYPCKVGLFPFTRTVSDNVLYLTTQGYINNPASDMGSVVNWDAGSTINFTLSGTATHGGGSCQMSMSYDLGKTWSVIESYMGGCPIDTLTYEVEIPKEAPSGEALFGWSWFNKVGNREMCESPKHCSPRLVSCSGLGILLIPSSDQNCAVVTVTNGGSGLDPSLFPSPFVANVDAAPGCHTIEGTPVVFPNPGSVVKWGGEYKDSKPTTPAGFTGDCGSPASSPSSTLSASAGGSAVTNGATATTSAHIIASSSIAAPLPSSSSTASDSHNGTTSNEAAVSTPGKCKRGTISKRSSALAKRHERLLRRSQHDYLVALQDRESSHVAALYS